MKNLPKILAMILALAITSGAAALASGVSDRSGSAEGITVTSSAAAEKVKSFTSEDETAVIGKLYEATPYYALVRHRQLGASHYAYTEALAEDLGRDNADPEGREAVFNPASELVLVTIVKDGSGYATVEDVLLESKKGVIRDPDVSPDGTRILFSWKKQSADDYHLYEMDISTREIKQLTFGSGIADTEGKYLSDGSIIFNSSRDIQSVDCWKTPVSNLYKCNSDGGDIIRLGYDQVHTTYPTVSDDGRIIYTRWDYNDRTQMWIQSVFQMFEDGTNQTELYGNNSDFPTSLLHTRKVPGANSLYISVASGHHVYQHGKLVLIDISKGRNGKEPVSFVFDDGTEKRDGVDGFGQNGRQYKYPYAINEELFLYSAVKRYESVSSPFSIYVYDRETDTEVELAEGIKGVGASQIVPIYRRQLFSRPSMVNYASETGTFYVSNVYEGPAAEGIKKGSVRHLRVVELEFRSCAIGATVAVGSGSADPFTPISAGNGAWDIKKVLGVVPVCEDGSAMFTAPANTPLYFQLLDENGCVLQTMRSWTTLMPNEVFSCVGCHEDKNIAPTVSGGVTMAMKQGVSRLEPDLWMDPDSEYDPYNDAVGFSYLKEVQPILDRSCVVCHSDTDKSMKLINAKRASGYDKHAADIILPEDAVWSCKINGGEEKLLHAPFGDGKTSPNEENTVINGRLTASMTFTGTVYDLNTNDLTITGQLCGRAEIKLNGTVIAKLDNEVSGKLLIPVTNEMRRAFVFGENVLTAEVEGTYFTIGITSSSSASSGGGAQKNFIRQFSSWEYIKAPSLDKAPEGWITGEDDSSKWKSGQTPFGDRQIDGISYKTDWSGSMNAIFIRRTFTVDDVRKFKNSPLMTNITYDDGLKLYLNGKLIFEDKNWIDNYAELELAPDASEYLVNGENILAASLCNTAGGRQIDISLYSYEHEITDDESEALIPLDSSRAAEFSLEGINIAGTRQKKYWPLSYLTLAGAYPSGTNWLADPSGRYVNFLSSMSGAESVPAGSFGSGKSLLIEKLRGGHGGLSDREIRTLECWIDLVVPAYGAYDENVTWSANDRREFDEKTNKRDYYDMMNKAVCDKKAGSYDDRGEVKIEYLNANGSVAAATSGRGFAQLVIDESYSSKQGVRITLPEGEKYVAVCLSSKLGESIVYCPDGVFEYRFPSRMGTIFPTSLDESKDTVYIENIISARLPTDDELTTVRNLSKNPYDLTDSSAVFPHATTNSVADGNAAHYAARCAIDGFTANTSHGTYPVQSWGPEKSSMSKNYLKLDFGRTVRLDSLEIIIRCDFPHDTWFTGADIELSDGTVKHIDMWKTAGGMKFSLDGVKTESLKLSGFTTAGEEWAAITEVKVFGCEDFE